MKTHRTPEKVYLSRLRRKVVAGRKEKKALLRTMKNEVAEYAESLGGSVTLAGLEEKFGSPETISVSLLGSEAAVSALRRTQRALFAVLAAVLAAALVAVSFFAYRFIAHPVVPDNGYYVVRSEIRDFGDMPLDEVMAILEKESEEAGIVWE